jgi:hypothetical protein
LSKKEKEMTTQERPVWFPSNIGMLLLGIWLILWGVFSMVHVEAGGIILAILAIITGIFILIGR